MTTLTIAFYRGRKRLFNRFVSWFLRGPYSHCELVLETNDGVSECISSSLSDGGVRLKKIELKPENWDLVEVPGDPVAALRWLVAHEGNGYDLVGLLSFVGRRGVSSGKRSFCSEAVAAMLGWPESRRFDTMTLYATCLIQSATTKV